MKKFKLLGLLILVFGIFAAQGATEEEAVVALAADAAEVEVLVRAARKDREDLIKELLTEEQMAQLAAKHQLKKDQTLIVYSDGVTAEVFNNNELQNLHVLKSVANLVENKFPGTVIELGIHFRKDSSLNALFDFVVELSNATVETIDDLHARLSDYSFTDLVIIAEMLDVLMLDNDDFNIEQFVANLLLQKFRKLSVEVRASFDLSLLSANVLNEKCGKHLLNVDKKIDNVKDVIFSPDGRRVVVVKRKDKMLQLYDAETLTPIAGKPIVPNIQHVAFSPDGKTVALLGMNNVCRMVDATTLEPIAGLVLRDVYKCVFSPDGRKLAVIKFDDNFEDQLNLQMLDVHILTPMTNVILQDIDACVFSPDGRTIATITMDNICQLYDARTLLPTADTILQNVRKVAFSPDGKTVAVITTDHICQLYDARTLLPTADTILQNVIKVAFSPGGAQIIVVTRDYQCQLYEKRALLEGLNEFQEGARLLQEALLRKDVEEKALAQLIKEARDRENRAFEALQELMQEAQLREQLAKEEEARLIKEAQLRKNAEERALKTEKRD